MTLAEEGFQEERARENKMHHMEQLASFLMEASPAACWSSSIGGYGPLNVSLVVSWFGFMSLAERRMVDMIIIVCCSSRRASCFQPARLPASPIAGVAKIPAPDCSKLKTTGLFFVGSSI